MSVSLSRRPARSETEIRDRCASSDPRRASAPGSAAPAQNDGSWRRTSDTSGFTLIEVLVAFAVLATLLSVLYRGVVGLRQGAVAFDDHTDRELVARAVLDEALTERDLKPGVHHGMSDGRRWTIVAKPIDLSAQLPPPADKGEAKPAGQPGHQESKPEWTMQRLIVRIESPGRPLEIETLRMVRAEP